MGRLRGGFSNRRKRIGGSACGRIGVGGDVSADGRIGVGASSFLGLSLQPAHVSPHAEYAHTPSRRYVSYDGEPGAQPTHFQLNPVGRGQLAVFPSGGRRACSAVMIQIAALYRQSGSDRLADGPF